MPKKNKILILFLILVNITISYGSDCLKQSKHEIFDVADFVFIGQILEVNTNSYEIKVFEMFKGHPPVHLQGQLEPDVVRPKIGELWLFYAQHLKDNKIIAGRCSGTKSFDWPHGIHDISFPHPPPQYMENESPQMFILEQVIKNTAWNELYYELMTLRQREMNDKINSSNKEIKELLVNVSSIKATNNILLVLVTFLVIVYTIVLFRKF
jgi:hypothetical protein